VSRSCVETSRALDAASKIAVKPGCPGAAWTPVEAPLTVGDGPRREKPPRFFSATSLRGFSSHAGVLLPPASCASRRNPRTWARGRAVKATAARARAAPPRGCSVNHITHQQQQRSASRCARRGVRPRRRAARGAASPRLSRASTRPRRRREGPRRARPRRTRQWRSTTPFDRPQSGIRAPPRDIKRLL